jgi:hypothetical protein
VRRARRILRNAAASLQLFARVDQQDGRTAPRVETDLPRVVGALTAVAPLARTVGAAIRKIALVSFVAAAVIVAAVLAEDLPSSAGSIVLTLLLVAVLAVPGVVLLLFYAALTEVLELPARLRDLPRTGREHAAELARLEREARAAGRSPSARVPLALWRLVQFLRSSGWILRPHAPVLALLSPALLVGVLLSVLATGLLVLVALVAVLASAVA